MEKQESPRSPQKGNWATPNTWCIYYRILLHLAWHLSASLSVSLCFTKRKLKTRTLSGKTWIYHTQKCPRGFMTEGLCWPYDLSRWPVINWCLVSINPCPPAHRLMTWALSLLYQLHRKRNIKNILKISMLLKHKYTLFNLRLFTCSIMCC